MSDTAMSCPPLGGKLDVRSGTRRLSHRITAEVRLIRDPGEDSSDLRRRAPSPLPFAPVLLRAHSHGPANGVPQRAPCIPLTLIRTTSPPYLARLDRGLAASQ